MLNLFIADDNTIVREGLKRILNDTPNMHVVGESNNSNEILNKVRSSKIDVILLDMSMRGPGTLQFLQRILQYDSELRVLILSAYIEDQYVIRFLKAGASGYFVKSQSSEELINAINKIASDGKYISQSTAEILADKLKSGISKVPFEELSDREFQIFRMLGNGNTNGEIANSLSLSPKTISTYRNRLLKKLGFKNNADIIRYSIENNFL